MMRTLLVALALLLPRLATASTYTTNLHLCLPDDDSYDYGDCWRETVRTLDGFVVNTNASSLGSGTVPSARLDSSSVTLLGPHPDPALLGAGQLNPSIYVSSYTAASIPGPAIQQSTVPLSALNPSGAATGQTIIFDGTKWAPANTVTQTLFPTWAKYTLTYSSFSTAGTSSTTWITTVPANTIIHAVKIKHSTSFSGGSISAYTVSVGSSGVTDAYASAYDVLQTVAPTAFQLSRNLASESTTSGWQVQITAIATGANLSAATQGVVDVWLETSVTP
jgi:hypothetical protein